jgi:hypothetical protein
MHYCARLFLVVKEGTDSVHSAHVIPSGFFYGGSHVASAIARLMVLLQMGFVISR